jgi:hypothetical protein
MEGDLIQMSAGFCDIDHTSQGDIGCSASRADRHQANAHMIHHAAGDTQHCKGLRTGIQRPKCARGPCFVWIYMLLCLTQHEDVLAGGGHCHCHLPLCTNCSLPTISNQHCFNLFALYAMLNMEVLAGACTWPEHVRLAATWLATSNGESAGRAMNTHCKRASLAASVLEYAHPPLRAQRRRAAAESLPERG